MLPLADVGVPLAGWDGRDARRITNEDIRFNGVCHCGHPGNEEIFVPYPAEGARGIGPSHTAIGDCDEFLRLKHRCCGGSCRHETFGFPRMAEPHWPISNEPGTEGMVFNWTKTGFKPFDIAVTAALLIAKRYYEMTCSSRVMAPGYAIGRMQKNCASGISGMEPGLEPWKIHRSNSGQSRTEHKVSET